MWSGHWVTKINKTIDHLSENAVILNQILSTSFSRKCIEISVENFNVDNIGALKGLKACL